VLQLDHALRLVVQVGRGKARFQRGALGVERGHALFRVGNRAFAPPQGELGIVRDLETDPLHIFSYLRSQDRIQSYYASSIEAYIGLYKRVCKELLDRAIRETMLDMKEDTLGNIQQCVDRYVVFYHGGFESHSILKPIDIVAKAIINSPLEIDDDDLPGAGGDARGARIRR